MLTKTENISIHYMPHLFSSKGHVRVIIGKHTFNFNNLRFTQLEFTQFLDQTMSSPFRFGAGDKFYWLFCNRFYKDTDSLDRDSVKALILSRQRLQQDRINRAKTITAGPKVTTKLQRGSIPDDVKLLVWQRDEGHCAKCGSQSELQYDHIIPFSVGGASTPENLQILCGSCNRTKSASVV